MSSFQIPHFGFSMNNQQSYGSPKPYHSPVYQPMPAVGTPSFGGLGRPNTPKELSRHSSYSTKETEPTIQSIQPSVERVRRHRDYYLEGGDIYFLVENYLFRVHRYFFERESPVFRKQFADIALNGHHRVGASDNDPLVLHDVRTDDFSRFLWVFYNPIYSIYDATTEDWAAILGLAHHWQFSEVKSLVVRELEKQIIPSIYKIVIYHRYSVDRGLLLPSYMDLVSRDETLGFEEAKDLGLETSLMIMTAREVVRKGEVPTSTLGVSQEELKNIIRQVFRFPLPRSDSPLSDVTAAESALEHRSPPLLAEKTDLPTVPEHENEPVILTSSASFDSPLLPVTETPAPAPLTTTPAPSTPNKKASSKSTPAAQKPEDTKPTPVSPPKEEPKPKDGPAKPTALPKQGGESKSSAQESVKPATEAPPKPEAKDNKKKPALPRLSDVSGGAGGPTPTKDTATLKDKEGDKPADNKDATDAKDVAIPPTPGQDPNGTPIGPPLLNQDTGMPSTGQSVSAKKTKTILARAGEIKRSKAVQETGTTSSNKGKGKEPESLKVPPSTELTTSSQTCSEPREPESGAKKVEAKTGVDGKGKKKVAGDKKKGEGKPAVVAGVDILKGSVKVDGPGDANKGDAGQDTKKPGEGAIDSSDNVTPAVTTDDTTKPVADNVKLTTMTDKKDGVAKGKADHTIKEEMAAPTIGEKTAKSKEGVEPSEQKVEPVVTDEGDFATPKRATKELPASPAKSLKEKPAPSLGLVVPKSPKKGLAPLSTATVNDSGLSPLQKVLKDVGDETLMERMARFKIGDPSRQPPKDMVPPAHTDLESDSECVTAPSGPGTPKSRAGRGSFKLLLHSEVPLSDEDEFFVDCDSNVSVSNFDGV